MQVLVVVHSSHVPLFFAGYVLSRNSNGSPEWGHQIKVGLGKQCEFRCCIKQVCQLRCHSVKKTKF